MLSRDVAMMSKAVVFAFFLALPLVIEAAGATRCSSRLNIFGGYIYPDGTSCKPNPFGGRDCRSPH